MKRFILPLFENQKIRFHVIALSIIVLIFTGNVTYAQHGNVQRGTSSNSGNGAQKWSEALNSIDSTGMFGTNNAQPIRFYTSNTEFMLLSPAGLLGINNTAPQYRLDVIGNFHLTGSAHLDSDLTVSKHLYLQALVSPSLLINGTSGIVKALPFDGDTTMILTGNGNFLSFYNLQSWKRSGGNLYYNVGNIGIGNTNPTAMLSVGSANQFQVNSSGNLVNINNIAYSWPATEGVAGSELVNDGQGNLSWMLSDSIGPWQRTGNNITYMNGNVGIGIANPQFPLHVAGDAVITGNVVAQNLYAENSISIGAFKFIDGALLSGKDSIKTSADLNIAAKGMMLNADTVRMENVSKAKYAMADRAKIDKLSADSVSMQAVEGGSVKTQRLKVTDSIETKGLRASGKVAIGTTASGPERLRVAGNSLFQGNMTSTGNVSASAFRIPAYAPDTNQLLTVDASGNIVPTGIIIHIGPPVQIPCTQTVMPWVQAETSGSIDLGYNYSGNVGIGICSPHAKLEVDLPESSSANAHMAASFGEISTNSTGAPSSRRVFFATHMQGSDYSYLTQENDIGLFWTDGLDDGGGKNQDAGFVIAPWHDANTGIRITHDGNVGIGIDLTQNNNPNHYKLAVDGIIGAKDVWVETNTTPWPDYVFQPKYQLESIDGLAMDIKTQGHLPGFPSAEKIKQQNGVSVASIQKKQQVMLEKYALYIIEMNKQIKALKDKNEKLQDEINKINKKIYQH